MSKSKTISKLSVELYFFPVFLPDTTRYNTHIVNRMFRISLSNSKLQSLNQFPAIVDEENQILSYMIFLTHNYNTYNKIAPTGNRTRR